MAKTYVRSFRLADEIAQKLESFRGSSLNEKFENLVRHCFLEMGELTRQIAQRRKELAELQGEIAKARNRLSALRELEREQRRIADSLSRMAGEIEQLEQKRTTLLAG